MQFMKLEAGVTADPEIFQGRREAEEEGMTL